MVSCILAWIISNANRWLFLLVFTVRTDETQELANCFDVEASVLEFGLHEHSDNIFSPVYTLNISVR